MTAFDESGPMGHLILRFTDESKSTLRFGFVIVDDRKRGRGYGREMLSLALRFAFEILRVERVILGVFENNLAAYRCYRAACFQDAPLDPPEQYRIFGETWRCLELKLDKETWRSAHPGDSRAPAAPDRAGSLRGSALRAVGSAWKSMRGKHNAQQAPRQGIRPPAVFL